MAKKKKEKIMAFDTLQPDTLHPAYERICRNFVCYDTKVRECLAEEMRRPEYKNDQTTEKEFDIICGYQTELRGGIGNLGLDIVSLLPVTLEKTVKTTTPYIYRTIDYSQAKVPAVFGTRKDALQLIQKRVKTKNVLMHYNGITERRELDIDYIDKILEGLEEDTIDFDIEAIGRGDAEGDMILVSIYKNCLKM
jgi:hypothetical protein